MFGQSSAGGVRSSALNVLTNDSMHTFLDAALGAGIPIWAKRAAAPMAATDPRSRVAPARTYPPVNFPGGVATTEGGTARLLNTRSRQATAQGSSSPSAAGPASSQPSPALEVSASTASAAAPPALQPPASYGDSGSAVSQWGWLADPAATTLFTAGRGAGVPAGATEGVGSSITSNVSQYVAANLRLLLTNAVPIITASDAAQSQAAIRLFVIRKYALSVAALAAEKAKAEADAAQLMSALLRHPAVAAILELSSAQRAGISVADASVRARIEAAFTALSTESNRAPLSNAIKQQNLPAAGFTTKTEAGIVNEAIAAADPYLSGSTVLPVTQMSAVRGQIGDPIDPATSGAVWVRLPLNFSVSQTLEYAVIREGGPIFGANLAPADPRNFAAMIDFNDLAVHNRHYRNQDANTPSSLMAGTTYRSLPAYIAAEQLYEKRGPRAPAELAEELYAGPVVNTRDTLLSYIIQNDDEAQKQLAFAARMPSLAARALAFMFLLCPIRQSVVTSMLSDHVPVPFTGFALRCFIEFDTAGLIACRRGGQVLLVKNMIFTWGQHPQQQTAMGSLTWKSGYASIDNGVWQIQHALITGVRGGFDLSVITGSRNGSMYRSMVHATAADMGNQHEEVAPSRGSTMFMLEPHHNFVGSQTSGLDAVDLSLLSATGTFEHMQAITGGNLRDLKHKTMYNSDFNGWWFGLDQFARTVSALDEANVELAASRPPNRLVAYRGLYNTVDAEGKQVAGKPPTGLIPAKVYKVGLTSTIASGGSLVAGTPVDCY